jgi:hypothetical protein
MYENVKIYTPDNGLHPLTMPFFITKPDNTEYVMGADEKIVRQVFDASGKSRLLMTTKQKVEIKPSPPYYCNESNIRNATSALNNFINITRTMRYLTDNLMWLYKHTASKSIDEFIAKHTVIIQDHVYPINPVITKGNGFITSSGKFILVNETMKSKIIFLLYMNLTRNHSTFDMYSSIKHVRNEFKDVNDFTKQSGSNIYKGESAITCLKSKCVNLKIIERGLSDESKLFQNDRINPLVVFQTKQCETLEAAIKIINECDPVPPNNEPIGVYAYNSRDDIRLLNNKPNSRYNILVSKNEAIEYTVLIPVAI